MKLIELIEEELKKDLPGSRVQFEMLPASRVKDIQKSSDNAKKSAVLLLLYKKNSRLCIVLIVRTKGSNPHSGQISFPGGKYEEFDKNLAETALREANEEIGVNLDNIKILGELSRIFIPVSNFMVYPFVAYHNGNLNLKANPGEVSELLEIPIASLLDKKNKFISKIQVRDEIINAPIFNFQNKKIWGATAMIINEFLYILENNIEHHL